MMDAACRLYEADCLKILVGMAADSIDACVTDPPYGLEFMGKGWDTFRVDDPGTARHRGDHAGKHGKLGEITERWNRDGRSIPSNRIAYGGGKRPATYRCPVCRKRDQFRNAHACGKVEWIREVLEPNSAPPTMLAFQAWCELWARAMLRVLKPGAHMLVFGGTRTWHRMACAIEDAGFEIRDTLCWLYGTGFPKSADVSKHIDRQAKQHWLNVGNAVDSLDHSVILAEWIDCSNHAMCAGPKFVKSPIGTGTSTPRSASVLERVALSVNRRNSRASAILAELGSIGRRATGGGNSSSAHEVAGRNTTALNGPAINADTLLGSHVVTLDMPGSFAQWHVSDCPGASTSHLEAAVEALTTWLGSDRSSKREATIALCVALTDALKHITLSQCSSFRNLGMKSQTECASAINATITESTAASLISFTADTLKRKAIDKAAGVEREVVGLSARHGGGIVGAGTSYEFPPAVPMITAPATPEAAQWDGWGTALKPAFEPIILARKPLSEPTVAANVLRWGTGAINIDACRVETSENLNGGAYSGGDKRQSDATSFYTGTHAGEYTQPLGRWPANVLHDGSDEVEAAFAAFGESKSGVQTKPVARGGIWSPSQGAPAGPQHGDSGTASRFFYSSKASKTDRAGSSHPTIKPVSLKRYLCKLITPPNGTVLDPFAGTGTTGQAALEEGFSATLIEREAEYCQDIRRRIAEM